MEVSPPITIQPAGKPQDIQDARSLFNAYANWLNIDLTFQGFQSELDSLPGKYAPPTGVLLLARDVNGQAIGCVAFRPLGSKERLCEMKRLYVLPEARRHGLGERLVLEILNAALKAGYSEIRLDTLEYMTNAITLYEKVGFTRIDAYYENPLARCVFLAKRLS